MKRSRRNSPVRISIVLRYEEFVQFVSNPLPGKRRKHTLITSISEIFPEVCEEFSDYLKTTSLAIDTHNRKIKRLRL